MNIIKRVKSVILFSILSAVAFNLFAQDNALVGSGSTLAYPFISKVIDDYSKVSHVGVNYQSIGSAAGVALLTGRTIDFAVTDIPLDKNSNLPVLYVPIAYGSVAIIYNIPGIKSSLKLSNIVLADIFLKKIIKWNDTRIAVLNPGIKLPSLAIQIVNRAGGSGTAYMFNNYLSQLIPGWKSRSINAKLTSKTNQGVAGWVKLTRGAIAYVASTYATQYQLPCAAIQGKSGNYIKADAINYPIQGLTWAVIYKEQNYSTRGIGRARQLLKLLRYATHTGQKATRPLGYQPLSTTLVKEAEKALQGVTYNGKPL